MDFNLKIGKLSRYVDFLRSICFFLLQIYVKFREVEPGMYRIKVKCRGIIFIRIQCSWVSKMFPDRWDVILLVMYSG